MPHKKLKVAEHGMLDAYQALLAARGYVADEAQLRAANALQNLYSNLLAFKVGRGSTLKRLLSPPKPPKGVYFWFIFAVDRKNQPKCMILLPALH